MEFEEEERDMGTCSMNGARFTVQGSDMGPIGKDEGGGRVGGGG